MARKTTAKKSAGIELLRRKTVYRGGFKIEQVRLRHRGHDGTWTEPYLREVFERGHAVAILPYDPRLDRVVLIEQIRVPALLAKRNPRQIEIAAGIIEAGETPRAVARRELMEETGLRARKLRRLFSFLPSPGVMTETIEIYLAEVDASNATGQHGLASEHEEIRVFAVPAQEAFRLVERGIVENGAALLALQWLALHHDNLRGQVRLPAKRQPR